MKKFAWLFGVALLAAISGPLAVAGASGRSHAAVASLRGLPNTAYTQFILSTFKAGDLNGDQKISMAEVMAIYRSNFNRMDLNHDGVVGAADIAADHSSSSTGKRPTFATSLGAMDTSHDGKVEFSEYVRFENKLFAPLIAKVKKKGYVSWADVVAFYHLTASGQAVPTKKKVVLPQPHRTPGSSGFETPLLIALGAGAVFLAVRRRYPLPLRLAGFLSLAVSALLIASAGAEASAFYNNTQNSLTVDFNCGTFCGNSWTVPGGFNSVSDPGDGGTWCVPLPEATDEFNQAYANAGGTAIDNGGDCISNVGDHDWVEVNSPAPTGGNSCSNEYAQSGDDCTLTDESPGNSATSDGLESMPSTL